MAILKKAQERLLFKTGDTEATLSAYGSPNFESQGFRQTSLFEPNRYDFGGIPTWAEFDGVGAPEIDVTGSFEITLDRWTADIAQYIFDSADGNTFFRINADRTIELSVLDTPSNSVISWGAIPNALGQELTIGLTRNGSNGINLYYRLPENGGVQQDHEGTKPFTIAPINIDFISTSREDNWSYFDGTNYLDNQVDNQHITWGGLNQVEEDAGKESFIEFTTYGLVLDNTYRTLFSSDIETDGIARDDHISLKLNGNEVSVQVGIREVIDRYTTLFNIPDVDQLSRYNRWRIERNANGLSVFINGIQVVRDIGAQAGQHFYLSRIGRPSQFNTGSLNGIIGYIGNISITTNTKDPDDVVLIPVNEGSGNTVAAIGNSDTASQTWGFVGGADWRGLLTGFTGEMLELLINRQAHWTMGNPSDVGTDTMREDFEFSAGDLIIQNYSGSVDYWTEYEDGSFNYWTDADGVLGSSFIGEDHSRATHAPNFSEASSNYIDITQWSLGAAEGGTVYAEVTPLPIDGIQAPLATSTTQSARYFARARDSVAGTDVWTCTVATSGGQISFTDVDAATIPGVPQWGTFRHRLIKEGNTVSWSINEIEVSTPITLSGVSENLRISRIGNNSNMSIDFAGDVSNIRLVGGTAANTRVYPGIYRSYGDPALTEYLDIGAGAPGTNGTLVNFPVGDEWKVHTPGLTPTILTDAFDEDANNNFALNGGLWRINHRYTEFPTTIGEPLGTTILAWDRSWPITDPDGVIVEPPAFDRFTYLNFDGYSQSASRASGGSWNLNGTLSVSVELHDYDPASATRHPFIGTSLPTVESYVGLVTEAGLGQVVISNRGGYWGNASGSPSRIGGANRLATIGLDLPAGNWKLDITADLSGTLSCVVDVVNIDDNTTFSWTGTTVLGTFSDFNRIGFSSRGDGASVPLWNNDIHLSGRIANLVVMSGSNTQIDCPMDEGEGILLNNSGSLGNFNLANDSGWGGTPSRHQFGGVVLETRVRVTGASPEVDLVLYADDEPSGEIVYPIPGVYDSTTFHDLAVGYDYDTNTIGGNARRVSHQRTIWC